MLGVYLMKEQMRIPMNLNFRGINPKTAAIIHAHRIEHGHKNLTETLECIIKQWDCGVTENSNGFASKKHCGDCA